MTHRVRLSAVLLGLLALLPIPFARAATGEGIILRGSTTSYVDLYVYVNATITAADLRMSTKGTYVGFFLSPAPANRDTVGALVMPRVGATGADTASTMQLGASWDVGPGKYRAFLITDGAASVFIPIAGQGYRGWVPRTRAPLSLRRMDFDIAAGATGNSAAKPVKLRQRSLVAIAGLESSQSLTAVDHVDSCVAADTAKCGAVDTTAPMKARVPEARQWTYKASLMPAGSYTGLLSIHRLVPGYDAPSHVDGALLILTIGIQS